MNRKNATSDVWGKASPFAPTDSASSEKSTTTERNSDERVWKDSPFAPSTEKLDKLDREQREQREGEDDDRIWKNSPFSPAKETTEQYEKWDN